MTKARENRLDKQSFKWIDPTRNILRQLCWTWINLTFKFNCMWASLDYTSITQCIFFFLEKVMNRLSTDIPFRKIQDDIVINPGHMETRIWLSCGVKRNTYTQYQEDYKAYNVIMKLVWNKLQITKWSTWSKTTCYKKQYIQPVLKKSIV